MGRKIFVSYKYADNKVQNLKNAINSTVRDYVDEFISKVNSTDDIYKGEHDTLGCMIGILVVQCIKKVSHV